jgi:hypothetical protein
MEGLKRRRGARWEHRDRAPPRGIGAAEAGVRVRGGEGGLGFGGRDDEGEERDW